MMALCASLWVAALAGISVTVAPDQPLPHVYIDEPLILELVAEESVVVSGRIRVRNDEGETHDLPLGEGIRLPAGAARWVPVEGLPPRRGNYHLEVTLTDAEDRKWHREVEVCLIERRAKVVFNRLVTDAVRVEGPSLELAARAAGLGTVRLPFAEPSFADSLAALLDAGLKVVVTAAPGDAAAFTELLAGLERARRDLVIRCELVFEGDAAAWASAAHAVLQGASGIEIAPVVNEANDLGVLMAEAGMGLFRHAVVEGEALSAPLAVRAVGEEAGVEHLMLYAGRSAAAPADASEIAVWLTGLLSQWGEGFGQWSVDEGHLLDDDGLGKAYPYLAMMAHRMNDYRFTGELPLEDGAQVRVFRHGAAWMLAAWSDGPVEVHLPVGAADALAAFDARGNPLSVGTVEDGLLAAPLDAMPRFWTGRGGAVIPRVGLVRAQARANAVLRHPRSKDLVHPDILEMIDTFLEDPEAPVSRRHFFTLLQSFPELEASWHSGREPVEDIVPLLARLAEFTRALCILEEEHGEQFLEPLPDTLASCSEYQALYVTGSAGQGPAHDRGDWLLRDIDRLTAEARLLAEHGRVIEANAVANLAEWRARALGAITQRMTEAR